MGNLEIEGIKVIELDDSLVNPVCMSPKIGKNWLFCMSSFSGWVIFTTSPHMLKTGYIGVLNNDGKRFLESFLTENKCFPNKDTWRHL